MKVCGLRFNIYLALALALLCGCQTGNKKNERV